MVTTTQKAKTIEKVKRHETDTGSPEVQIALLTEEIAKLLSHLKKHAKDFGSKRGLLKMVSKRKTLLKYLEKEDKRRFNAISKQVGLQK